MTPAQHAPPGRRSQDLDRAVRQFGAAADRAKLTCMARLNPLDPNDVTIIAAAARHLATDDEARVEPDPLLVEKNTNDMIAMVLAGKMTMELREGLEQGTAEYGIWLVAQIDGEPEPMYVNVEDLELPPGMLLLDGDNSGE
jgi:hypothetical protein